MMERGEEYLAQVYRLAAGRLYIVLIALEIVLTLRGR